MESALIREMVILFSILIFFLLICLRLRVPTLVGLIVVGIVTGPYGFSLVKDVDRVEVFAEIGIILLLFSIGIEFSLRRFIQNIRQVLLGGGLQVGCTILVGLGIGLALDRPWMESLFLGFILSLSSTAIVLNIIQERNETNTPLGSFQTSLLIFQDIIAVPMMLMVPILGGENPGFEWNVWVRFILELAIFISVLLAAHFFIPHLFYQVAKAKSSKLFLFTVLFICFGVAWASSLAGFSLALGAFLAGLIISETQYHQHALGNIFPFQELFTSIFFISMGMLLDITFVFQHPFAVFGSLVGVMIMKSVVIGLISLALGFSMRTAIICGLSLAQVGEFSFVLVRLGIGHNISSPFHYQLFLTMALISMAITPVLINNGSAIALWIQKYLMPGWLRSLHKHNGGEAMTGMKGHVIIIGADAAGLNLAYALKKMKIPYIMVDNNPDVVTAGKLNGEPIIYGDATHVAILQHVFIDKARIVAILLNHISAIARSISAVRQVNPDVYVITRARSLVDVPFLTERGADDVIPDELETSIEIFSRVLRLCLIPKGEIDEIASNMRKEHYAPVRDLFTERTTLSDVKVSWRNMQVEVMKVDEDSPFSGKTLEESGLRRDYNVTVLLIVREGEFIWEISGSIQILAGDTLVLFGHPDKLQVVLNQ